MSEEQTEEEHVSKEHIQHNNMIKKNRANRAAREEHKDKKNYNLGGHSRVQLNHSEFSKRGWRTEGVGAKKSFLCQRLRPLFCTLFPMPPLGEEESISGGSFWLFWGPVSRQPLFETSESLGYQNQSFSCVLLGAFSHTLFPSFFPPLFPLQALFTLPLLLTSSPPPLIPPF